MIDKNVKGKIVSIRPLKREEAEQVCAWRNDPEVSGLFYRQGVTPEDYYSFLDEAAGDPDRGVFAIETAEESAFIGTITYEVKRIKGRETAATIGIMIGEKTVRGGGRGSEAMELLSALLAAERDVKKIKVEVFTKNEPAISFYKKLGFAPEIIVMTKDVEEK